MVLPSAHVYTSVAVFYKLEVTALYNAFLKSKESFVRRFMFNFRHFIIPSKCLDVA